jgi:hypothetical protein
MQVALGLANLSKLMLVYFNQYNVEEAMLCHIKTGSQETL